MGKKGKAASALDRHVDRVIRECRSGRPIDGYSDAGQTRKAEFHRSAREVCKALGRELGKAGAHVHTNMGGPAVAGETYLHTGEMMVEIAAFCLMGPGPREGWVLFRRARGKDDWAGGPNAWMAVELLRDLSAAARTMKLAAASVGEPISIERPTRFVTEAVHG